MDIGRLGEQSVYEIYLDQVRRSHDFNFPSGHPLLGSGRLVEVRWVNGDGESWLPYDLIVFLEGTLFISLSSPGNSLSPFL